MNNLEQYQETGRRTPSFWENQHISYKEELRLQKERQERIKNTIENIKQAKRVWTWSNSQLSYVNKFTDEEIEKEIEFIPYI